MKAIQLFFILLLSLFIGMGVHYFEYWSNQPRLDYCFSQNTPCFKDYKEGLDAAKLWNKPVILMFSGWASVNSRKWYQELYQYPSVLKMVKEDFVLIVLHVDDKTTLAEQNQFTFVNRRGKEVRVKTVGDESAYFMIECGLGSSQPKFFLLNSEEDFLVKKPFGYNPDFGEFASFLEAGLGNFRQGITEGKLECDFLDRFR